MTHFHVFPDSPDHTPPYCVDHAPDDEPMYECYSERCLCVVCEEEDPDGDNRAA